MKRIFITPKIERMAYDFSTTLFTDRNLTKFDMPKDKLQLLENTLRTKRTGCKYADYVHEIYDKYSDILRLKPSEFENYKTNHFSNLTDAELRKPVPGFSKVDGIKKIQFYKLVVNAMRYDGLQKKDFRPYIKKLGIRTCVYCNAQYAITTSENKGQRVTYQLDHFKPQSEYPFLCTSFFNLQPSCGHCNQSKSDNPALFRLYTEDYNELYPFFFHIDPASIAKYMLSHNCDCLDIRLDVHTKNAQNLKLLQNHQDRFHIDQIYSEFTDTAEEIIWKAKIYNKTYREQLMSEFKKLFANGMIDFSRFFYGFYIGEEDILKRPLTKLMQKKKKKMGLLVDK